MIANYMKRDIPSLSELRHLLGSIRICLQQGASYLVGRIAPNGPIMKERNLDFVHKTSWGMYAAGVDHSVISTILDWTQKNALQQSGDFYFPEEGPEYKDMQRAYRPLTFLKVAAWMGHPLACNRLVVDRLLQYQHSSGGVFNCIGDDPARPEFPPTVGSLNTSFFGHLMVALNMKEQAVKAGDWICRLAEMNRENMMEEGVMYTQMTQDGKLLKDVRPGEKMSKTVNNRDWKQEFWHVGTSMAYLCTLYDKVSDEWRCAEQQAHKYLDAAMTFLAFEETMPVYTYFWPSKCKVGWGAGELLRILTKYGGSKRDMARAYHIARKVAVYTFMDNQLLDGSWSCLHYPLSELIPEIEFDYKPLKGTVNVPRERIPNSNTIFLPPEETTGEFIGEMKVIEEGVAALLKCLTGA